MNCPQVLVTPEMLSRARQLAQTRNRGKESWNRKTSDRYANNSLNPHLVGAVCELVFSQWSGLPVDEARYKVSDGGVDFIVAPNITVDVKGRLGMPNDLASYDPDPWRITSDFIVLVVIDKDWSAARIIGYATKIQMVFEGSPLNFGNKVRWGLPVKQLRPIEHISKLISRCDAIGDKHERWKN